MGKQVVFSPHFTAVQPRECDSKAHALFWTSPHHGRLWQCLFLELQLNILKASPDAFKVCIPGDSLPLPGSICFSPKATHLRGTGNILFPWEAAWKKGLWRQLQTGELVLSLARHQGESQTDAVYAPANIHQLAKWMISAAWRECVHISDLIFMVYSCVFTGDFCLYTWSEKIWFSNLALLSLAIGLEYIIYLTPFSPSINSHRFYKVQITSRMWKP